MPVMLSICLIVARSACATPKTFFASSVTNFTLRSGARTIPAAPAARRICATLLIAGDADSTGKCTTCAFGSSSTIAAGAAAARAPELCADGFATTDGGGAAGGGVGTCGIGVVPVSVFDFAFFGVSHLSHRIPCVIVAPHMKHLEAIGDPRT